MIGGCQQALAECGVASHYWEGARTANGERYNHLGVSAAHKTLPFGSLVRVTHRRTNRSVVVRINDRGPFVRGRIIDLSTGAKRVLGMDGLAPVCLSVVALGRGGRLTTTASRSGGRTRLSRASGRRLGRYVLRHRGHTLSANVKLRRGKAARRLSKRQLTVNDS